MNILGKKTQGISLIQGSDGTGDNKNFEMILSSNYGGLQSWYRDNGKANIPWGQLKSTASFGSGYVTGCSLIESDYVSNKTVRHLEAVIIEGSNLFHYYRYQNKNGYHYWAISTIPPINAAEDPVQGSPSFIQGTSGSGKNKDFQVVAPLSAGGIVHYCRTNSGPQSGHWKKVDSFGTQFGKVDDVVFFENTGYKWGGGDSKGNYELIARVGSNLYQCYRDAKTLKWTCDPNPIATDACGTPSFIQTQSDKNFQLVYLTDSGKKFNYYYRDNQEHGGLKWHLVGTQSLPSETSDGSTTITTGVTLIQSSYQSGTHHNLELQVQFQKYSDSSLLQQIDSGIYSYNAQPQSNNWKTDNARYCSEPNQADFETKGLFVVPYNSGVVGISAAMLHTDKVLFFDYGLDPTKQKGKYAVFDLKSGQAAVYHMNVNLFCSGLAFFNDGTLVTVGGHGKPSVQSVYAFDPEQLTWSHVGQMPNGRWYPTCTTMTAGKEIFAISGSTFGGNIYNSQCDTAHPTNRLNATYQMIKNSGDQSQRIGPEVQASFLSTYFNSSKNGKHGSYALYPFVYLLPGNVLFVFGKNISCILEENSSGEWIFKSNSNKTTHSQYPRIYPVGGTSVILPLASDAKSVKVMVMGGAGDAVCPDKSLTKDTKTTNSCEIYDMSTSSWQSVAQMNFSRVMPDSVLLPNKKILIVNGSSSGYADNMPTPVLTAEMYDSTDDAWSKMNSMRVPRLYHSTALLLPDGRVITAGKGDEWNHDPYKNYEIRVEVFYPPYLFIKEGQTTRLRNSSQRPCITSVSSSNFVFGQDYKIGVNLLNTTDAVDVVLIAPGAVTHAFNMNQRLVSLKPQLVSTTDLAIELTVTVPGMGSRLVPAQYYMLFVVQDGIPSTAKWVKVSASQED